MLLSYTIEEFELSCGTFVDIDVEFDMVIEPADMSVGLRAGAFYNGTERIDTITHTGDDRPFLGWNVVDMLVLVDQWACEHDTELCERAMDEAANRDEAARDAYWDAKFEESRGC